MLEDVSCQWKKGLKQISSLFVRVCTFTLVSRRSSSASPFEGSRTLEPKGEPTTTAWPFRSVGASKIKTLDKSLRFRSTSFNSMGRNEVWGTSGQEIENCFQSSWGSLWMPSDLRDTYLVLMHSAPRKRIAGRLRCTDDKEAGCCCAQSRFQLQALES